VVARFVREGQTADEAIRSRLERLGRQARNLTVVSSDRAVQSAARSARAHFISSEAFAEELVQALDEAAPDAGKKIEAELSEEEIEDWLDMFNPQDDHDQNPQSRPKK
jgi:predicted RNA-binding protein with PIN domain